MCPRCHNLCMVPIEHNGVVTMDACPSCTRRAEAEWMALTLPALPVVPRLGEAEGLAWGVAAG